MLIAKCQLFIANLCNYMYIGKLNYKKVLEKNSVKIIIDC